MDANTLFVFTNNEKSTKTYLRSVDKVTLDDQLKLASSTRFDSESMISDSPPIIRSQDETRLNDLYYNFITSPELPREGQILYSKVAGPNVKLSQEEIDAIQYSLDNQNCCLYEILKEKDIKKPSFGYIRATFPDKFGNSPGHPYVCEIWPKLHGSPIHDHGNTMAVIKVLHGRIRSDFFNPLPQTSFEIQQNKPIKSVNFTKGQTTWMTPDIYQTHRLINESPDEAAITIQAYSYLDTELYHDEKFNFIENNFPNDPDLKPFFPVPDLFYADLINSVLREFRNKKCFPCLNGTDLPTIEPSSNLKSSTITMVSVILALFIYNR